MRKNKNEQQQKETLASRWHRPVLPLPEQVLMVLMSKSRDRLQDAAFLLSVLPHYCSESAKTLALPLKPVT